MTTLLQVGGTGEDLRPILKFTPQDFAVQEIMLVDLVDAEVAEQRYLLLRKTGYSTMEAIRLIAGQFQLPTTDVTFGGLKDEDGVTQQLIAVPAGAIDTASDRVWQHTDGGRTLELRHYGHGREPLRIGALEGNGFRIVVRNLDDRLAHKLTTAAKINFLYLNYYDTQRFGVMKGPKRTHWIGRAILEEDWDYARTELIRLAAPESALAASWPGTGKEFFQELDWRTTSFYLAAYESYMWNSSLRDAVDEAAPDEAYDVTVDGMVYRYVRSPDATVAVMGVVRALPYTRYTYRDGELDMTTSFRPTVMQTNVAIVRAEDDDLLPGRDQVRLTFFLPSGSYATAMIRQLLEQL